MEKGSIKKFFEEIGNVLKDVIQEALKPTEENSVPKSAQKKPTISPQQRTIQPTLTPQQAQQAENNRRALLLNVAEYVCQALPAIPEFIDLYTDATPQTLMVDMIAGNQFSFPLYKKKPEKHIPTDQLQIVRDSLNNAFANINHVANNEIQNLNFNRQQELVKIANDYQHPDSHWYGNQYRYQSESARIEQYYCQQMEQRKFFTYLPRVSGLTDSPESLKVMIVF